jgi:hypothetical protein
MTIALANCILHSRRLVTKVHQFEIVAVDAARGVIGHHDGRRRENHQHQSGEYDQLISKRACLPPLRILDGREKPGRHSDSDLSLWQFRLLNNAKEIVSETANNDHGRDGPKQQNWHFRLLLIGCPHQINAGLLPLVPNCSTASRCEFRVV